MIAVEPVIRYKDNFFCKGDIVKVLATIDIEENVVVIGKLKYIGTDIVGIDTSEEFEAS